MKLSVRIVRALFGWFWRASWLGKSVMLVLLGGLLLGMAWPQDGNQIEGVVVGVADGDTITVLDQRLTQHKIRFAFIDAPEKNQPYGKQAKQQLSDLVYRQLVRVDVLEQDRYGRNVGRIWLGNKDINLALVQAGYAWHYQQYAKDQPSGDFRAYEQAQLDANARHDGLWRDTAPVAPWDFRRQQRRR